MVGESSAPAAVPLSVGNPPSPGCASSSGSVRLVPGREGYVSLHPSASGLCLSERMRIQDDSFACLFAQCELPCCWSG